MFKAGCGVLRLHFWTCFLKKKNDVERKKLNRLDKGKYICIKNIYNKSRFMLLNCDNLLLLYMSVNQIWFQTIGRCHLGHLDKFISIF